MFGPRAERGGVITFMSGRCEMRGWKMASCLVALLFLGTGCMALSVRDVNTRPVRHVAVVNGEIYVVDTKCNCVYKFDRQALAEAKTVTPRTSCVCSDDCDDCDDCGKNCKKCGMSGK